MRTIIRILSLIAFVIAVAWACYDFNFEPILTSVVSFIALISTFIPLNKHEKDMESSSDSQTPAGNNNKTIQGNNNTDNFQVDQVQNLTIVKGNQVNTPVPENKKKIKTLGETPVRSEIFLGRDEDLKAVHERLFSNKLLLLVNGIGGIGKTTLASHYYHTYFDEYENLIWIAVTSGIVDAFDNIALALQLNIDPRFREEERLNKTIKALLNLEKPCLLVLDNANSFEDLEKYYSLLRRLSGIHVLVTTRVSDLSRAEIYPVGRLD
ncbi:hypothetical protein KKHLCK_04195 [Candidatus Electrothrix laxa]